MDDDTGAEASGEADMNGLEPRVNNPPADVNNRDGQTCGAGGCDRTEHLRRVTGPADAPLVLCPRHFKHYWGVSS